MDVGAAVAEAAAVAPEEAVAAFVIALSDAAAADVTAAPSAAMLAAARERIITATERSTPGVGMLQPARVSTDIPSKTSPRDQSEFDVLSIRPPLPIVTRPRADERSGVSAVAAAADAAAASAGESMKPSPSGSPPSAAEGRPVSL